MDKLIPSQISNEMFGYNDKAPRSGIYLATSGITIALPNEHRNFGGQVCLGSH